LIELAKTVKKFNGIYTTHIRNEQDKFLEAIEEAIKIAEESGVKLHISHLKVMGEENWKLMDSALEMISQAFERGVDITFDIFPYTNTGTVLYTLLSQWVSAGGKTMMLKRLKDPSIRLRLFLIWKSLDLTILRLKLRYLPSIKRLAKNQSWILPGHRRSQLKKPL